MDLKEVDRLRGGPTQEEVIHVALGKLRLRPDDVFLDLGCGTGAVTLAAARSCAKVHALDMRPEAVELTRRKAEEERLSNVQVWQGEALDILPRIGRLDAAFVGGSKGLEGIIRALVSQVRRRFVIAAVKIDTLHNALSSLSSIGALEEAVHLQVNRSYPIAGGHMFKPIDPVYLVIGRGV
ncbi:MAG: precorrin-6Y C5,15-methyltransferase (decarboxylating) subunit CbiT [Methanomassiliicoccales archaeon]